MYLKREMKAIYPIHLQGVPENPFKFLIIVFESLLFVKKKLATKSFCKNYTDPAIFAKLLV